MELPVLVYASYLRETAKTNEEKRKFEKNLKKVLDKRKLM